MKRVGSIKVGSVEIPSIEFEDEEALARAIRLSGDETSYVAKFGISGALPEGMDRKEVKLYAALQQIRIDPSNNLALIDLAWTLQEVGWVDDAVRSLEGWDLDYCDCPWHDLDFNAGWILAESGRLEEALDRYERAVRRNHADNLSPIHCHAGAIAHKLGRFDEAVRHYGKALEDVSLMGKGCTEFLKSVHQMAISGAPCPPELILLSFGVGREIQEFSELKKFWFGQFFS